jgi:hypothetical protein
MSSQTDAERRLIAADPSTDPEILRKLEYSSDPAIREAVTLNPNTPVEVLLRLGAEFPAQFLDNPLFPLLLLENPNLHSEIPIKTLASLVKQENVPVSFLLECAIKGRWLDNSHELLLGLTINPNLPRQALERLIEGMIWEVSQSSKLHINWAGEVKLNSDEIELQIIEAVGLQKISDKEVLPLQWLAKLRLVPDFIVNSWLEGNHNGGYLTREILPFIYLNQNINSEIAQKLAEHSYWLVRQAIANHHHTPISVLEKLAEDKYREVRQAIAVNPKTPVQILEKLAYDIDAEVRQTIARNPCTPQHTLDKLSRDRMFIRRGVAENIKTNHYILKDLAEIPFIRCSVLINHNCPEIIRRTFWKNTKQLGVYECLEIAKNPLTPSYILDMLALDKSRFPETSVPKIAEAVARNSNTSVNTFEKIVRSRDAFVREMFLAGFESNPNIDREDLVRLSNDSDFKYSVAAHPNLPITLIEDFFRDKDKNFYLSLAKNPATPSRILAEILESLPTNQEKIRQLIAKHPHTSGKILNKLALDSKMHSSLMENPNLPINLWEKILPFEQQADKILPIYLKQNHPDVVSWALRHFAKFDSCIVNLVISSHPQADPEFLAKRASSIYWVERWAVAQNPNTPNLIREKLVRDGNIIVRKTARDMMENAIADR